MALDHDDITELKRVFDDRYVQHDTCNDIQKKFNDRLADGNAQFKVINLKLSVMTWGIGIIASTAIGALIKSIIELILK